MQFTHQYVIFTFSETISMSEIQFFYYKAKYFQHFDYIYKLTRECKLRNFGEKRYSCSCIETTPMPKDVILKLEFLEFSMKITSNWYPQKKVPYYIRVLHNRKGLYTIVMFRYIFDICFCFLNRTENTIKRSNCMESDTNPLLSKWFWPKISRRSIYFINSIHYNFK